MSRIEFASLKRWRLPVLGVFALMLAACGDSTTPNQAPTVAGVEVLPAQHTLVVGDQRAFSARALDAQGQEIQGRSITWSSSNLTTATVSATGTVSALAAGTSEIRASVEGKVGTGQLTVTLAPVASLTLTPVATTITEGETQALVAVAKDAAGRVLDGRTITWTSANTNVATVSATGTITGIVEGSTDIAATVEGITALTRVTVSKAAVARVELHRATLTMEEGTTSTVGAVARDAQDRVLAGRTITWTSSNMATATVDAHGMVTAVQAGQATVTASVEGKSATLVVTVSRVPVASVEFSPKAFVLEIGESRQLTAVTKDAAGNVLVGRAVQWAATNLARIDATGTLTGLQSGYITITATSEGVATSGAATVVQGEDYAYDLLYHRQQSSTQAELFVMELGKGTGPVKINAGNVSRSGTASADGSRVAFAVSMVDLGTQLRVDDIFAVDITGLGMKQLTTAIGNDVSPAWSPTGARIAYNHYEIDGRSDIWIMNADGTLQANLTADMSVTGFRSSPTWSPDGQRIAFAQMESGVAGTESSIWTMRADGTDKRRLTSTFTGFDASPTWAGDGSRIAFVRFYNGDADITLVDVNGGATHRIALPGLQAAPSWSPDGKFIAFSQDQGPLSNLYTIRPDGTQLRLRTVLPVWGGGNDPAWILRR